MGIPFSASLHHLVERVSVPFHHFLHPVEQKPADAYALLWDCYLSGQMSDANLDHECKADPGFASFVRARELRAH